MKVATLKQVLHEPKKSHKIVVTIIIKKKKISMIKKKLISCRKKVNRLYFEEGLSKREIIKKVSMSSHFVVKWTQSPEQDMTEDHRGWEPGNRRKWTKETEDRIKQIHHELCESDQEYFTGATAINQTWLKSAIRMPHHP